MNEQAEKYIHRHRQQTVVPVTQADVPEDKVIDVTARAGVPVVINLGGKSLVISGVDLTDHVSFDVCLFDDTPDAGASKDTGLEDTPPTPVGVFGFVEGARVSLGNTGRTNHGWPAVTTVVLLADKVVEAPRPFEVGDTVYTAPGQHVGDKGVIRDIRVATRLGDDFEPVDFVQVDVAYLTGGSCIVSEDRISHVEDAS